MEIERLLKINNRTLEPKEGKRLSKNQFTSQMTLRSSKSKASSSKIKFQT